MPTLSYRERELVALGAALAANCIPCVDYHVPQARKAGLSDAEIAEAIALADKIKRVPADKVLAAATTALGGTVADSPCCRPDQVQEVAQATGCCPPAVAQPAAKSCC